MGVATLGKTYERTSRSDPSSGGGRRASGRHSSRSSPFEENGEGDGYTSPPPRRAKLAPSSASRSTHRPTHYIPPSASASASVSRNPSFLSTSSAASSYAPTPFPSHPSRHLAPPPHAQSLYRNSSLSSSIGSETPYHSRSRTQASTPAFRPSPSAEDDDRGMDILSFPWSHTPYTPSMSPPYLPTLRGVVGRSGMGIDRRDTSRRGDRERDGRGNAREGRGGVYSDAEEALGRERERRGGRERGRGMEELYGDVQRSLGGHR